MNAFYSPNSSNSNSNFILYILSAAFLLLVSAEIQGQNIEFQHQETKISVFENQPMINPQPFYEDLKIMPFTGNKSFERFHLSDLKETFEVFPNPAAEYIRFNAQYDGEIQILTPSGHPILSQEISQGLVEIKLDEVPEGIYIISLKNDLNCTLSRLVVKK